MNYKYNILKLSFLVLAYLLQSCTKEKIEEETKIELQAEEGEEKMGGINSVSNNTSRAFGISSPSLDFQRSLTFELGDAFFTQSWVIAPASTTARDGLGPTFNARACGSCHGRDGRGRAPDFIGEKSTGYLIRLSIAGKGLHNQSIDEPTYGGQLQDQAIFGVSPEGDFMISYSTLTEDLAGGEQVTLHKPEIMFKDLASGPMDASVLTSARVANQMIGLGLLEAIDETTLLSFADEFDSNQDGVSGRPNYVYDVENNKTVIGRFGWKANQPNLKQQNAGAFLGDMGLTSSLFPTENCPSGIDCDTIANGGTPEVEDKFLDAVTFYTRTLAVPNRRNVGDQEVLKGKQLFAKIGCNNCHKESVKTGDYAPVPEFSNQTIHPYTDLLLHDMGDGLADGRPDFLATGNEWRTPPLWGIGLFQRVNSHTKYLHDGRANNIEEAILWHGGEALKSKSMYKDLVKEERNQLLKFLESL